MSILRRNLGPEEVQAGLPDRPDPRMGGKLLDLGQGLLQAAAPGVAGGVVGVEGNSAQEP